MISVINQLLFIYKAKHILVYSNRVKSTVNYDRKRKSNTWDITVTSLRPRNFSNFDFMLKKEFF